MDLGIVIRMPNIFLQSDDDLITQPRAVQCTELSPLVMNTKIQVRRWKLCDRQHKPRLLPEPSTCGQQVLQQRTMGQASKRDPPTKLGRSHGGVRETKG